MSKAYLTIGFLGSGKSTWAKNFVKEHSDTKIVSPDSFREMLNGEYKYLVELDDVITQSCFDTAKNVLEAGYDVIIDCGNLTNGSDRRSKWKQLPADKFVAVLMPQGSNQWHVQNRLAKPHWKEVDCGEIIKREKAAFEPIDETDFDEIIKVEKWEG